MQAACDVIDAWSSVRWRLQLVSQSCSSKGRILDIAYQHGLLSPWWLNPSRVVLHTISLRCEQQKMKVRQEAGVISSCKRERPNPSISDLLMGSGVAQHRKKTSRWSDVLRRTDGQVVCLPTRYVQYTVNVGQLQCTVSLKTCLRLPVA